MGDNKPFVYAGELFLGVTAVLGELTDALLEGKVTKDDLEKWQKKVEPILGEMKLELFGAYVISGSATDDLFKDMQEALNVRS